MNITLAPHQQALVDRNPHKHLLAFDTGTGKTYTSLALVHRNDVRSVLVISPKSIISKWCDDIGAFHGVDSGNQVIVQKLCASYYVVTTQYRQYHIVTKEYHRDARMKNRAHFTAFIQAKAYIVDEAHYYAGITSRMAKCLYMDIQQYAPSYVWLLTATPFLSTPWNIYMLGKHLGHEWNYGKFRKEMFVEVSMGGRQIYKPKANAEVLLKPYVSQMATRVDVSEVIADLPPQDDLIVDIALTDDQIKAIKEDDATDHIVMWTRKHQIENGYIPAQPMDNKDMKFIADPKFTYIRQYVDEQGGRCAIVCRYTAQINRYEEALRQDGYDVHVLTGETKDRASVIKAAQAGGVFLAQASISEGYELPYIENVLFASLSFSYKDYKQMRGRFLRMHAPTPTVFTHLIVKDGIDKSVYKSVLNKQDFNINMYYGKE